MIRGFDYHKRHNQQRVSSIKRHPSLLPRLPLPSHTLTLASQLSKVNAVCFYEMIEEIMPDFD